MFCNVFLKIKWILPFFLFSMIDKNGNYRITWVFTVHLPFNPQPPQGGRLIYKDIYLFQNHKKIPVIFSGVFEKMFRVGRLPF